MLWLKRHKLPRYIQYNHLMYMHVAQVHCVIDVPSLVTACVLWEISIGKINRYRNIEYVLAQFHLNLTPVSWAICGRKKHLNMSYKWQDETTRQNAQESSDYAEITNVQPSFSGLSVSGAVPQHAIASPRTSKKRSFLASLSKGTQRKGTIITRPMNQESMPEEPLEVSSMNRTQLNFKIGGRSSK